MRVLDGGWPEEALPFHIFSHTMLLCPDDIFLPLNFFVFFGFVYEGFQFFELYLRFGELGWFSFVKKLFDEMSV